MGLMQDKVALVTGGGTGIGKATALKYAAEGAKVVIGNRNEAAGQAVVEQIKADGGEASFLRTDVTDEEQIKALVDHAVATYGRIDAAFNNAGVEGDLGPFTGLTNDNYDWVMGVNVKGLWQAMKYEIEAMLKTGGGAIVNNSSIAGVIGFPGASVYVASKHAVMGLTRSAALEYSAQGIRINAVNPAAIQTDMMDRFMASENGPAHEQIVALHPIGRLGKPEEIANMVVWLSSDEASFVTGQPMLVDGGFTTA